MGAKITRGCGCGGGKKRSSAPPASRTASRARPTNARGMVDSMAKLVGSENGFAKVQYNGDNVGTTNWLTPTRYSYRFSSRKREFLIDNNEVDIEHFLSKRNPDGSPMFTILTDAPAQAKVEAPATAKHVTEREDIATQPAWEKMAEYAIVASMVKGTGSKSALGKDYNRITLADVEKFIDTTLEPRIAEEITAQAVSEAELLGVDPRRLLLRHTEEGKIGVRHVREFHKALQDAFAEDQDDAE